MRKSCLKGGFFVFYRKISIKWHLVCYCTRVEFSELKIPYNTVVVVDFADSECEASAKSVTVCARREQ